MIVNYLLKPPATLHNSRPHIAIGILVGYSILLLLIASTYFRLFHIVATNPGYVPRGPQYHAEPKGQKKHPKNSRLSRERNGSEAYNLQEKLNGAAKQVTTGNRVDPLPGHAYMDRPSGSRPLTGGDSAPNLREFYTKDVFICEGDGRPVWCSTCLNWKPDRTHHCREAGRCVKKMDHFCPW